MNQRMGNDQRPGMQRASSHPIRAFLLGLLGGLVPFLLLMPAVFSPTEETGLMAFILAVCVELLATLLLIPLALLERTRPIAWGLFLPCLVAACLETFGPFSLQPITPCTAALVVLAGCILLVSWLRKRTEEPREYLE